MQNFVNIILALQIESQSKNAFEIAESIVKKVGLIKDLEKEGTPEAVQQVKDELNEMVKKMENEKDGRIRM